MWGLWFSLAAPHSYCSSKHLLWLPFLALRTMTLKCMLYIYLFLFIIFVFPFPSAFRRWCLENWSLGDAPRLPGQAFRCNDLATFRHKSCFCSLFHLLGCKEEGNPSFYFLFEVCTYKSILVKVILIWEGRRGNYRSTWFFPATSF